MKKWSLSFYLLASLFLSCTVPCHAGDSSSFTPVSVSAVAPSGGAVPVGTVITWPFVSHPEGWNEGKWLECNGQTIASSAYPELYALGYSSVPDFRNRTLWGDTSPRAVKTAGLPNITGYMSLTAAEGIGFVSNSHSGALTPTDSYRTQIFDPWGGQTCYHGINFNAANSNSIYGNSSTVQPPALTTRFLIRAKP